MHTSLNIEQEIHTYAYRLLYALVLVHEKNNINFLVFMQLLYFVNEYSCHSRVKKKKKKR